MKKIFSALTALAVLLTACALFTPAAAAEEVIRVACCGDSITEGWTSSDLDTCSYPAQLQKMLDPAKYEVKNFGIGGRCALKDAGDYTPYWNEAKFYKASLTYQPNIVILMLGTNDVVCNKWNDGALYGSDLADLVRSYQALESKPTVYLCTPCYSTDGAHTDKIQNGAVPLVKKAAEETGATLVDVNAYTANYASEGGLNPDGIHLSDDGYLRLAGYFYDTVFGGACSTLTVATDAGNVVSADGMYITADESGKAVLRLINGEKTIRVRNKTGGFGTFTFDLQKDTVADCRGLNLPANLAAAAQVLATVTENAANVCDGDESTSWQIADMEYDAGLWIGFDFGEAKAFDTVDFVWDQDSRPTETGYVLETSDDGQTWTELSVTRTPLFSARSTVTFPQTTARFVRVRLTAGSNDKYRPMIREMRVLSQETLTPSFTEGSEISVLPAPTPEKKENGVWKYLLVSAGIVAVAGLAAALTVHKQKKSNGTNSIS